MVPRGIFSQSFTQVFLASPWAAAGGAEVAFLAGLVGACWAATVAAMPAVPAASTTATAPARRSRSMIGDRDPLRCIRQFPPLAPRAVVPHHQPRTKNRNTARAWPL